MLNNSFKSAFYPKFGSEIGSGWFGVSKLRPKCQAGINPPIWDKVMFVLSTPILLDELKQQFVA